MIRPVLKRVISQVLVWSAVAVLGGGCVALAQTDSQTNGQRSDSQVEMDVVRALDDSQALKNDLITAATVQGEVTLSGTVANAASKELAESIVTRVQGVTKIHNNLKVGDVQAAQDQAEYTQADDANADQIAAQQEDVTAEANQPQSGAVPEQEPAPSAIASAARPAYQSPQQAEQAQQPATANYQSVASPVIIPQGTLLQLRTSEAVSSKNAKDGSPVEFVIIRDVVVGGTLAIPRGATVHGVVSEVKKSESGELAGSAALSLKLTSLELGGQSYNLSSDEFKVQGPNKAGRTVSGAIAGGVIGTIIGCAAGRGTGCAVGAGVGAAAGTAASAASPGPDAWIPSEARVDFHLNTPITVTPVSSEEALRLSQGLYPAGPTLNQRAPRRYARSGYPAGGYPPVYYRPYYAAGGYYYWR
jgi:hypothetical protein